MRLHRTAAIPCTALEFDTGFVQSLSELWFRVKRPFGAIPIQMPPVLDGLIREHLDHRGKSLYASRDTGWLFPGGNPGRHLATENIRCQLVAIGIKPYENRKATLFQLAGDMPAPVLAELIGITHDNAAAWAGLSD